MLRSASSHYRTSALLARRAAEEASRFSDSATLARILFTHQLAQVRISETAVDDMLAEQSIEVPPVGALVPAAFTTERRMFTSMLAAAGDAPRLVGSLVQDSGRAAESVAVAARPGVGYVRYLSPPSCSRCAVLAGRMYRFSRGFQRHPGCDCTMIPSTRKAGERLVSDPTEMVQSGQVTGLSKADLRAVADGADLNQVVNVRSRKAGLRESGRVLSRAGRLTPEGIYRLSSNQRDAAEMLRRFGYIR